MSEFKSMNGYTVKDETARKAVSDLSEAVNSKFAELDESVEQISANEAKLIEGVEALEKSVSDESEARSKESKSLKQQNEVAKFFFPSLESAGYTGSSAIATIGGKCVLLDCGPAVNLAAITDYYSDLYEKGVFRNIDYIVISHYHYDHIENLEPILDLFPHEGVKVYLPLNPDGYLMISDDTTEGDIQTVKNNRNSVIAKLQSRGLQYVEVSQETTVQIVEEFCDMILFNSSAADYLHYQQNSSKYNNFSMCTLFKTGDVYSLFPGDAERDAQQRILNTRTIPKLFLYAIHHHGYQNDDVLEYLDAICPVHGVISANYSRMADGSVDSMAANYAIENVYSTAFGACEFVIGKDSGSVVRGMKITHAGWHYNYIRLYVNNEYTGASHRGTEKEPFTSINELNLFLNENRNQHVIVYVKATGKPYGMTWLRNYQQGITIRGYSDDETKPVVSGLYISGCDNVTVEKMEISGDGYESEGFAMVHVMTSSVVFSNCKIRGKENNATTKYKGIQVRTGSDVYVTGCDIQNCYHGIAFYRHGQTTTNTVNFADCQYAYMLYSADLVIRGYDTIANVAHYIGGSVTSGGAQYRVSTREAASTFKDLIVNNDANVISVPFYHEGIGVCIAIGGTLHKLTTEAVPV